MKKHLFFLTIISIMTLNLQGQVSKTLNCTAGGLASVLDSLEKRTITNLILTGTIDARDFKIMRDSMSVLEDIDLSGVSILEYTGKNGTSKRDYDSIYHINSIPKFAFSDNDIIESVILSPSVVSICWAAFNDCDNLKTFTIPTNSLLTTIESYVFEYCIKLDSIYIPNTVKSIGEEAFANCHSFSNITIPSSVNTIDMWAFADCSASINVDSDNPNYSSLDGVLYNKDFSTLIQCPNSKIGHFSIPTSVDTIGNAAFDHCGKLVSINLPPSIVSIGGQAYYKCISLVSITIPAGINSIKNEAFYGCTGLKSIYIFNYSPIDLSSYPDVFYDVNKDSCTLYVPSSSIDAYQNAEQWKDFKNIEEMNFDVSSDLLILKSNNNSNASIIVSSNFPEWTLSCDQAWLTLSTTKGTGNDTIILTASANAEAQTREATVDFLAGGIITTVTVLQIAETQTDLTAVNVKDVSMYPNPTQEGFTFIGIESAANFEFYDISGRMVLSGQLNEDKYVPATNLSKGTYVVKISTNAGVISKKLVKE
jgi:hypothetical protein